MVMLILKGLRICISFIKTGSDGLLIGGTTGESPSMNEDEKLELFPLKRQLATVLQ